MYYNTKQNHNLSKYMLPLHNILVFKGTCAPGRGRGAAADVGVGVDVPAWGGDRGRRGL